MTRSRFPSLLALAAATVPLSSVWAAAPTVGRYDGQFCVSVAAAAADCGPAQVEVLRPTRLRVRISDIVYHLKLNSSQLEVVLMHGSMQIDEFVAPYDWVGSALQFDDVDKRTRYELRLAEPVRAEPRPAR